MRKFLIFLLLSCSLSGFSQKTSLQGKVLNAVTNEPMEGIFIQFKSLNLDTTTGSDGSFYFEDLTPGNTTIVVTSPDISSMEFPVNVLPYQTNDIGTIYATISIRNLLSQGQLPLIEEEAIGDDSELGDYNVSSLMTSANDVYISNASYNFSAVRFKFRGYENRYSDVYINGVNFNDPERGGFSYGLIGGLNDATRSKDASNWYSPSTYSFGQVGGATNIHTEATNFAPGGRASVAYTNRNYKLRGMATYSTGLMDNGWAVTGSLGYRWADEGFIEGTFYNSLGYMLSIEKVIDAHHSLSFTTLGSPTQRAQSSANVQETMDLLDNNYYNSYWGWQNGEKRNSRIITAFEPSAVLAHKFQINKDTRLTTSLGFKYTMYGGTALNWYNSADPRPDYYRYLPSYQTTPEMGDYYTGMWSGNKSTTTQVDWERLYRVNALNKMSGNGNASYMVEERHNNQELLTLNSILNAKLADRITLTAGIEANTTKGMHYKTLNDLLGADYFIDVDQFAERDFQNDPDKVQNNLNNPDRKALKGDRFGYDYDMYVSSAKSWLQNTHRYNKWDVYYGFAVGYTTFHRNGNMKNGRAPENSYGKGETHDFITQSEKFGLTYKLSGKHIFSSNVSYSELPPLTYNAYLSSRIKDNVIPNLTKERVFSADFSYHLSTPVFRGMISVFQTNFYDQAELTSFYYDLDRTFIDYGLTGVNKMHRGVEFGLEAKLNSIFTLSLAGTVAEYVYTNRPEATVSYDNGSQPDRTQTVYFKNYYVGGTPQTAGTVGIHAFYNYWFFDLNLNGFDRIYIDPSPIKRTEAVLDFVTDTPEEKIAAAKKITNQEKFEGGFTLDASIGKSLRLNKKYTLNINAQVANILNNTKLKTGGFEQSRFDYTTFNVDKYPNKYYYAQGFNCFVNVGLRF
jgi:hypothetical protein